jgi:tyrosinase
VSADCIDIESQLGYSYGPGSLDASAAPPAKVRRWPRPNRPGSAGQRIDRTKIAGSFIIAAYAEVDGAHRLVGAEAVLSRWTVAGCATARPGSARGASSRSRPTRPTAGSR